MSQPFKVLASDEAGAPPKAASAAIELTMAIVSFVVLVFQFLAFVGAYAALDDAAPDREGAVGRAWTSLGLGAVALGLVVPALVRQRPVWALVAVGPVLGGLIGGSFVPTLDNSFREGTVFGFLFWEVLLAVVIVLPGGITGLVMTGGRHRRTGWGLVAGTVAAHAVGWGVLAVAIVSNVDRLAAQAQAAHAESPAWGALGAVAAIVTAAVVVSHRRRRARTRVNFASTGLK